MKFIVISIILISTSLQCLAQGIILSDSVCKGENFLISTHNEVEGESYDWDYCSEKVSELIPNFSTLSLSSLSLPFEARCFSFADNYLFIPNRGNGKLFFIELDDEMNLLGQREEVILPEGIIQEPISFDLINLDGNYIGYLVGFSSNSILKLNFGAQISNSPVVERLDLGSAILSNPNCIKAKVYDNKVNLFISNFANNKITYLSYSVLDISIPVTNQDITISGASQLASFDMIAKNDHWIILAGSLQGLFRIDFDKDNLSAVIEEIIYIDGTITQPTGPKILFEGGVYSALVVTRNGAMYSLDFGEAFEKEAQVSSLGATGSNASWSLNVIKTNRSRLVGFFTKFNTNNILKVTFDDFCNSSVPISENALNVINYNTSGRYTITLTKSLGEDILRFSDFVKVKLEAAPDINFNNETICSTSPVEFSNINNSGDITSYDWSFGDSNTSAEANPSNQYAASGDYTVNLSVESANGCSNFVEKDITIYDEPVPSFDLPTGLVCTNDVYTFTNTTEDTFEGNLSWEWQVNGDSVNNTQNLNYEFPSGGDKEIKLIASIPGCAAEATDVLTNINEGPVPAFQVNDDCVGTPMQFSNQSEGNITDYDWDFGNGYTSSLENPLFEYGDPGTFDVTLNVTNDVGCESDLTRSVSVYQLPNVQFSNELACEGSLTQFIDATQVGDANLQAWNWEFDDGEFSTERNPTHNFTEDGRYDVQLAVTTTNGCKDSLQQRVVVNPAPEVDFSYDKLCLNEEVEFTDLSEPVLGFDNISWAWDLGGVYSGEQNPSITFEYPINYNIGLTVTSENLCSATEYKTITVNPVPNLSFASEFNCDNSETHIYDLTDYGTDAASVREWSYSNVVIGSDSSIYYAFDNAGTYELSLLVDTQNGCTYEGESDLAIYEAPIAQFSPSITFGAPPLDVDFTNESIGAESYRWYFGDVAESTDENVSYTFVEEADYWVDLVAFSAEQCTDTTSQIISVLDPNLELELANVFYQNDAIILNLRNNGTISLDSIRLDVDMGNEVIIERIIPLELLPGQQRNITLDFTINRLNAEYLCISAFGLVRGVADTNLSNNTQCVQSSGASDIVVLPPRPNPSPDAVFLRVVTAEETSGSFFLYDIRGQVVKQYDFSSLNGYQLIEFKVSDLNNGLYVLKSKVGDDQKAFRLTVKH
ncbi:PKD domain-containing protein [Fulvivirga maritima]|uniref:PKD domain-containing protein n=1 Tax=Fulvivirga maritima TaxID=2904247 RepID=UPI001F3AD3BD|nr:PKD domain-containing protein [Fulvivirga maritima]UII27781.1 PKD domain-containing protein [Fulvivirga maritima]